MILRSSFSRFPPKVLRRRSLMKSSTLLLVTAFLLGGCAHPLPKYEPPMRRAAIQKVRTTAYTQSESDHLRYGARTAIGTALKYGAINSAAADWARWPCGTIFRIRSSRTQYHRPLQALQKRDEGMGGASRHDRNPQVGRSLEELPQDDLCEILSPYP